MQPSRERLVAAVCVEKPVSCRLTLTLPVINHAARAMFLASGKEKAAAVKSALDRPVDGDSIPAAHVRPVNGSLWWVSDEAAAAGLQAVARDVR